MQFVVNPGGAVHGVADEEVETLIHERGMRLANDEERRRWHEQQGLDESGQPNQDRMREMEEAQNRRNLGAHVQQQNAPTEPYATLASDSPLARVREAKRQRVLAVEATLTPTDPVQGQTAGLADQIARNNRVIAETNKANQEAVQSFNLPTEVPSATNQRAWLGSAEPKSIPGVQPTPAHPAETGRTIGETINPDNITTDLAEVDQQAGREMEEANAKTSRSRSSAKSAQNEQTNEPAETAENR